jgi:hypothetical protein
MIVVTLAASLFLHNYASDVSAQMDNMTSSLEAKIKSFVGPSETVFVLVCPGGFQQVNECQLFTGQPTPWS